MVVVLWWLSGEAESKIETEGEGGGSLVAVVEVVDCRF